MPQLNESKALILSLCGALLFALFSIGVGFYSRSGALLLDGGYSFISAGMTFAGLQVTRLLRIPHSKRFHFGYNAFEPLFVMFKGLLILVAALIAFSSSVQSVLHGGRDVAIGPILGYLVFAAILCLAIALVLRALSGKFRSSILRAESTSWMLDAALCVGAFAGFFLAVPLKSSSHADFIPYIDPVITALIVAGIIAEPLKLIRSGALGLLGAAPPEATLAIIRQKLESIEKKYGFYRMEISAMKTGRRLRVTITCICPSDFAVASIATLDEIRETVRASVAEAAGDDAGVEVVLTAHGNPDSCGVP